MDGTPTLEASSSGGNWLSVQCQQCDRIFSSERSLRCHVKVHNDKVLKCCFCDQMFNRTDTLFFHALDHISKGTLPCRASDCEVVVESMADGEQHANSDHGNNGVPAMKCKECAEVLPSFRKMLYHFTFKHGELKKYADEMTAKQKEFLRAKKNQSRKGKPADRVEVKIEEDLGLEVEEKEDNGFNQDAIEDNEERMKQEEEEETGNGLLEQLQAAIARTTESNTDMIGKLSDVITELFPLSMGEQYQCLHCMIGFTDAILWMTHLGYHDAEQPFKCTGCKRKFESRQTFVLHLTYFSHGGD